MIVLILVVVLISGIFISARTRPSDEISAEVQAYQLSCQNLFLRINVPGWGDGLVIDKIIIFSENQIDTFRTIKKTSLFLSVSTPLDSVEVSAEINQVHLSLTVPVIPGSIFIPDPPVVSDQPENAGKQIDLIFGFSASPDHNLIYPSLNRI